MKSLLRNLILITLIGLMLTGCGKNSSPEDNTPPQTIIVYLAGVSLGVYFNNNIRDIKSALAGDIQGKSRVVIFQHKNKSTAELVELYFKDGLCEETILTTYDLPAEMNATSWDIYFRIL